MGAPAPPSARFAHDICLKLARAQIYVIGIDVAAARSSAIGGRRDVNNLDEIVDRAIEYTNLILTRMPSYSAAAITGLRTLRDSLAAKSPTDPAIHKLDDYLNKLSGPVSNDKP